MGTAPANPLTMYAAVLSDPSDGQDGERSSWWVEALLRSSAAYVTVEPTILEGRLGESPPDLYRRCWNDARCWREAGLRAGVEQFVLVERVDERTLGLRVVDVASDEPIRLDKVDIGTTGRHDPDLVDRLFFQPGALHLQDVPPGAALRLDHRYEFTPDGELLIDPIAAGKHILEMDAPGHAPLFTSVLVYSGQRTTISSHMTPLDRAPRRIGRWTTWWAMGVVAGGVTALAVTHANGGTAQTP